MLSEQQRRILMQAGMHLSIRKKFNVMDSRTDCWNWFDWTVCLLTLKRLVSLQTRARPSVQAELDLHTTADR